jgi:ABC-type Fe3+ transport system substrate-binding protein
MRQYWKTWAIVLAAAVIVALPLLLRPAVQPTTAAPAFGAQQLVIITPHNEQIRFEFARAFNDWRIEQNLPPIQFDWRAGGGTSDLRKQVLAQLQAAADQGAEDGGIGVDLFFGGGDFEHNRLAQGVTVQRHGQALRISASVPPQLPPGLLEQVFPQPTLGGEQLYHPDLHWLGVALSSFGIVYNHDLLNILELPQPTTWADLADARYLRWLALADPAHSGSVAQTYNVILRRQGWTAGWALLRRAFANSRYFTASSSKVPVDVSAGEAAAGMCIDFYGRFQAGAVGGQRVGYVDPPFMTATTADPISIIRGAPHRPLADDFVIWLLSPPAQRLWQRRLNLPDGPTMFELRRQPIRRDLYTPEESTAWTDPQINPFQTTSPVASAMPNFYGMVAPLSHAMAIDVHDDLVAAWAAILRTPDDNPKKTEILRLFDRLPDELTLTWPDDDLAHSWLDAVEQGDHPRHHEAVAILQAFGDTLTHSFLAPGRSDHLLQQQIVWTRFFRQQYRQIVKLAAH